MMTLSFAFLFEAPEVIILVAGVILAARWLRRAPRAAKLALIGLGLMLAAKMARVGITISSLLGVGASGAAWWGYSYMVFAVGLLAARCVGLALLVIAIFTGRPRHAEGHGFEVHRVAAIPAGEP